jgi:signal transduction histidine kinase
VALALKLRLLRRSAERQPASVPALADQLARDANDALENLGDLARGIYPPLLADKGLVTALEAQARKAAVPVEVDADPLLIGRHSPEVEATVYFCTLEANNAAKYGTRSGSPSVSRERTAR